ncbi:hypothetical protein M0802_011235 [Mischocyttarus mexicanus]|nr:hypothetical protein M0802_011235 [Mischocyttarus mexicanus]
MREKWVIGDSKGWIWWVVGVNMEEERGFCERGKKGGDGLRGWVWKKNERKRTKDLLKGYEMSKLVWLKTE